MSLGNGEPHKPDAESGSPTAEKETKETTKKIIRVLTVIAYLSSVSMAAIMLSLYYIFLWNPMPTHSARVMPDPPPYVDTSTPSTSSTSTQPDRMMNRTWVAPEEPRALPVQISDQSQLGEVAHLHSEQVPESWQENDYYKSLRGKRAVKSILKVLKLKPLT